MSPIEALAHEKCSKVSCLIGLPITLERLDIALRLFGYFSP